MVADHCHKKKTKKYKIKIKKIKKENKFDLKIKQKLNHYFFKTK
jgi:hypothetical protein